MDSRCSILPRALGACLLGLLLCSLPAAAAESAKGRTEVGAILDGILNSQFRRLSRVRAALFECELDDEAAKLAPNADERQRGMFEFSKAVFSASSPDIKAWLKQTASPDTERKTIEAMYSVALDAYFSGVRDGASGSLIWVDDDDKKKLCAYMVREAEEFTKLRLGE